MTTKTNEQNETKTKQQNNNEMIFFFRFLYSLESKR